MRTWTSVAPALRSSSTIRLVVVPRTIESSTTISRFPLTTSRSGLSLIVTPRWRSPCDGWMKVRPAYRFRYIPSRYGCPDASANPAAAGAPVSGTGMTRSASTGCSMASCIAHPPADLVQVAALHVRIRAGEVDELEHAQRRRRRGVADRARGVPRLEDRRSRRAPRRGRTRHRRCRVRPSPTRGTSRPTRRRRSTGRRPDRPGAAAAAACRGRAAGTRAGRARR